MSARSIVSKALAVSFLFAAIGCSTEETSGGPGPLKVTADEPKSGAWVGLEPRIENDKLVVDVVAHDVPALSGVAVRLEHPEWAKFESRDVGAGWDADALHLVKTVGTKEVSVVDTAKGEKPGRPGGAKVVVSTLRFTIASAPTSGDLGALRIVPIRSELRDGTGKPIAAQFSGARFAR